MGAWYDHILRRTRRPTPNVSSSTRLDHTRGSQTLTPTAAIFWREVLNSARPHHIASHGWHSLPDHPSLQFVPAQDTDGLPAEGLAQRALAAAEGEPLLSWFGYNGTRPHLYDVRTRCFVLPAFNKHGPLGLVLVAQPLLMLDLGGGCCRPPPPLPFHSEEPVRPEDPHTQWLAERGVHFTRIVREAGQQPEHEWLLLACHCHSSTYYHAVAEAAPKIIWAMPLLRSNPNLKVLHDSTHVSDVLELLKLPKRGLMQCSRGAFARRLTIPPAPLLSRGLLSAFRDELWRSAALTAPPKSKRKPRLRQNREV